MFDRDLLLRLALENRRAGSFIISVLSREYLQLGILWARSARRAGIQRFAIAAVDSETAEVLESLKIPHFRMALSLGMTGIGQYQNPGGFDSKGMAIIHSRLTLVKFLVDNQIDVIACDIDSLLMRDPQEFLPQEADIAFQRVVYFPKPLARIWGFTGCGGFVTYRSSPRVSTFLDHVLAIQQEVSSDQIAFNLALFENGVRWSPALDGAEDDEKRKNLFALHAAKRIHGMTDHLDLSVEALPADIFWRHEFVPLNLKSTVLLHPNSPKSSDGKLKVFRNILGEDLNRWLT